MTVKNLFKKASFSSEDASTSPVKNKFSDKSSTPPTTPSPTKEESNLSVRVIPSQREPIASLQDHVIPEDDSTLFTTVLGMGCGSPLWDRPGSSLTPIPEENADARVEWGTPPSYEEISIESLNHDDFEVVLQNEGGTGADALNLVKGSNGVALLCQPCQGETKKVVGVKKKQKKRFVKLSKMMSRKGKSKTQIVESTEQPSQPAGLEEAKIQKSKTLKKSAPKSPKSIRNMQVGKLFHARTHKKQSALLQKERVTDSISDCDPVQSLSKSKKRQKRGRWKCVEDPTCNKVYYYHTRTREVTWNRPREFVEWRVAYDLNKNHFFYNAITKETKWEMPEGFEQWSKVKDDKSGKHYYYNILSRETTWEIPIDWNSNCKETAVTRSPGNFESLDPRGNIVHSDEGDERKSDYVIEIAGPKKDIGITDSDRDSHSNEIPAPEKVLEMPVRPREEALLVPLQSSTQTEEPPKITMNNDQAQLAKLLSTYCPDEKENNAQLMNKSKGHEKPILKGIEALVEETPFDELRLAIFSYVKTTLKEMGEEPFDERNIGRKIQCPPVPQFSPNKMNRVASNSISVAGYSLGSRALSHVTGRSVTTNLTEQTNRINNTSNRVHALKEAHSDPKDTLAAMNERWNSMNLGHSFDDMTDDEIIHEKVFLEMKMVRTNGKAVDVLNSATNSGAKHAVESNGDTEERRGSKTVDVQPANTIVSETPHDAETLESAYAADNDDETDSCGWDEEDGDDVSALSDSFGPSITKRLTKENEIITSREESLLKDKAKKILSKYARDEKEKVGKITDVTTVGHTLHPNCQNAFPNEVSSNEYEELPRILAIDAVTRSQNDEQSLSSWDDDTVTTNSST